ncbi:MAG: hypothetical protein V1708_02785 [Candidatus Micrarchaeota archaeon]
MKTFLITRPRHDSGLHYLHAWSEKVIAEAETRGWKVSKADDEKANKKGVRSRLLAQKHDLVMFNGHGNDEEIAGHNNETLVDVKSSGLLKDAIVFARACNCLNGLGKAAVRNGSKAFIGYKDKFTLWWVNEDISKPMQDPAAEIALSASNQVPIGIIKGNTVKEAVESSKKIAETKMIGLLQSKEPYSSAALRSLISHYFSIGFEGNPDSRVG